MLIKSGRKDQGMKLCENGKMQAFVVNALLALLIFGTFMIREKGLFSLSYDFNSQLVPFTKVCLDSLHGEGGLWNWNIDLGTNLVSTMSYYRLGSPFFWLFSWCNGKNVLYIMGWEYVVKYAVTGLISYCYLRRHTKSHKSALAGSILYSFSGFQTINLLFGIFHDAVAFFPLLLMTLDDLVEKDKKGFFALAVFLNAVVNYYCFIGEVVFLAIYFIMKYVADDPRRSMKKIGICFLEGILGVLMASVLFVPSILATLKNARVSDSVSLKSYLELSRRDLLSIISAFLLPAEMMMKRSYAYAEEWTSRSAYLPLTGIVLEGAYLLKRNRKDWLKRLLLLLTILMIIPIGNGMFSLFTTDYCRWYYMPVLFMALASAKVLDEMDHYQVGSVSLLVLLFLLVWTAMSFWWHKTKFELILNQNRFLLLLIIALSGILILLAVRIMPCCIAVKQNILLGAIFVFALMTTAFTCGLYQKFDGEDSAVYQQKIDAIEMLQPQEECRYVSYEDNLGMLGGFHGINSFISTISGSIPEFWDSLGLEKIIFSPVGPDGTEELLSVKYVISDGSEEVSNVKLLESFEQGNAVYHLYEKSCYLNIGFTYDQYMLKSDFLKLDQDIRAIAMLSALVINDEDAGEVQDVLTQADLAAIKNLSADDIEQLVTQHKDENAEKLDIAKDFFECEINSSTMKFAFFSVPYDEGWSADVNGKQVQILNVNGMMAIPIEKGMNAVRFRYLDKNFVYSVTLSIVSFLIWIGYYVKYRSKTKRYEK